MGRPKAVFTIDEDILKELNYVSEELKEKKSHIVEKALIFYFDAIDVQIADKRMKDLKDGKEELVPAEDIFNNLEL